MDVLRLLLEELGLIVNRFSSIADTLTLKVGDSIDAIYDIFPAWKDLRLLDPLAEMFPDYSLFALMFTTGLSFFILFTVVKWVVDLVL